MTREATLDDIPAIVALTKDIHSKTHYCAVPLAIDKYTRTLRMMINSKQHIVLVADHEERGVVGVLLGVTQEHFALEGKYATDLMIYADPKYPGAGLRLVRRFLVWARNKPDVSEILMGISTDLVDETRLGAFYERQGLKRMGGLYAETRGKTKYTTEVA